MHNIKSYKKAGTFYLFGNVFNKGIAFLTVPIFTRILNTSEYGILTTFNSWVGIFSMILGMTLHMAVRSAYIEYKDNVDDVLATITVFTILNTCIVGLLIIVFVLILNVNLSVLMIILCILQGFSNAIIEDYSVYLMMQFNYIRRTILMIVPNLLSTSLSIIVISMWIGENRYFGKIIPTSLTFLLVAICIVLLIYKNCAVFPKFEYLKFGLKVSVPLIFHGLALNILSQSDRTMITLFANSSQTGIYSLVYNFSMIAIVITSTLDGIWVPWFTKNLVERRCDKINEFAINYVNLITYFMLGLILIGPEVLKLLATNDYWEGVKIIPPVVLANYVIFAYTLYVNIEHYHNKTANISKNTLIAAITNLVLNYLFIPIYGYVAAAFTTLFSYSVCLILHFINSNELEPDIYPIHIFIKPTILLIIFVAIYYVFIDVFVIRWIFLVLYSIFFVYINKDKILSFFPELKV